MNQITDPQSQSSIPNIASVSSVSDSAVGGDADNTRILGRQIPSGNIRGNQKITGNIIVNDPATNKTVITLSGGNQAITIVNDDGSSVGMGAIPDGSGFGFFALDVSGKLIMKIINGTWYTYNPADHYNNVMQGGLLPDGTGGWAVAAQGYNVGDGIQP